MAYSRTFITLKQGCNDYVKDMRCCVGRAIVERQTSFSSSRFKE